MIEILGVLGDQHGVLRGMVIDDIQHQLHAAGVHFLHQAREGIKVAVGGVDGAEIHHAVRRTVLAQAVEDSAGMDGHQPHHVHTQCLDAVQIGDHTVKVALVSEILYG